MYTLRDQWADQTKRRRLIAIMSGELILVAIIASRFTWAGRFPDILMVVATVVAGVQIARRAIDGLWRRQVTIELLVTIAATGALIIGEYWEAAAVTFLFVVGGWLEARTMSKTRAALAKLIDLAPVTAWVLRDGEPVEVDAWEVEIGERVMIRLGGKIPVDGIVRSGCAAVDESAVTGEPIPVEKRGGDRVFAGAISHDGVLFLEATGVGEDTTLARIIHRVEEAQEARAPAQRTIERFASWYTPAIIVLAAGAWIISRNVGLALTLLVIGCPGALVIATPVAIVAGIGRAARLGILIKGGEHLETIGRLTALALDKTGTLTRGQPVLTDVVALQPALVPAGGHAAPAGTRLDVLHWAAIAERGSTHPLARPIIAAAEAEGMAPLPEPDSGRAVPGKGIWAEWQGHTIGVGSESLLATGDTAVGEEGRQVLERLRKEGKTATLVAVDREVVGVIAVADVVRESSAEAIRKLRRLGPRRIAMLTGDSAGTSHRIATAVGIEEVHTSLLPDDKLAWIGKAQADGEVVGMVGDGINDAPALAAADVGIAMGAAGSDVALETADVALMTDRPERIADALRISRKTTGVVRQNLAIAFVTVSVLLAGVLIGRVDMAGGMLIHEGSVLLVIANGMRLTRA